MMVDEDGSMRLVKPKQASPFSASTYPLDGTPRCIATHRWSGTAAVVVDRQCVNEDPLHCPPDIFGRAGSYMTLAAGPPTFLCTTTGAAWQYMMSSACICAYFFHTCFCNGLCTSCGARLTSE